MWRRVKQFAVGLSLVLCVMTAAVWLRSYWRTDAVVYLGKSGHRAVQWVSGVLMFGKDNAGAAKGKIWVDSDPGRGATFHIELPA